MTTTTRTTTATAVTRPRGSTRLAIDPYRIEEMTWTRTELLRARGQLPVPTRRPRRRPSR